MILPVYSDKAEQLSDTPCQVIPQEDTFFNCPQGRIKLRELGPERGAAGLLSDGRILLVQSTQITKYLRRTTRQD